MARQTVAIRDDQKEWLEENHINLSSYVREAIDVGRDRDKCFRCGDTEAVENHHVSYEQDITIPLCRPCHSEVHTVEDDELFPDDIENSPHRDRDSTRPKVRDEDGDLIEKVDEYAREREIRAPRAWAELVKRGYEHSQTLGGEGDER